MALNFGNGRSRGVPASPGRATPSYVPPRYGSGGLHSITGGNLQFIPPGVSPAALAQIIGGANAYNQNAVQQNLNFYGSHPNKGYDPGVARLQQQLRSQGFNIAVDGIYGPQTDAALRGYHDKLGTQTTQAYQQGNAYIAKQNMLRAAKNAKIQNLATQHRKQLLAQAQSALKQINDINAKFGEGKDVGGIEGAKLEALGLREAQRRRDAAASYNQVINMLSAGPDTDHYMDPTAIEDYWNNQQKYQQHLEAQAKQKEAHSYRGIGGFFKHAVEDIGGGLSTAFHYIMQPLTAEASFSHAATPLLPSPLTGVSPNAAAHNLFGPQGALTSKAGRQSFVHSFQQAHNRDFTYANFLHEDTGLPALPSTILGLGLNVGLDPANLALGEAGLGGFRNVSEKAGLRGVAQATRDAEQMGLDTRAGAGLARNEAELLGRARYLDTSKVGHSLLESFADAAESGNPLKLVKQFGLTADDAKAVLADTAEGLPKTRAQLMEEGAKLFETGQWKPSVSLARQLGIKAGLGLNPEKSLISLRSLGEKLGGGLESAAASSRNGLSPITASDSGQAVDFAIQGAAGRLRTAAGDLVDKYAPELPEGHTGLLDRAQRLDEQAAQLKNPGFTQVVEDVTRPLRAEGGVLNTEPGQYGFSAKNPLPENIDAQLTKVEALGNMLSDPNLPADVRQQVESQLASHFGMGLSGPVGLTATAQYGVKGSASLGSLRDYPADAQDIEAGKALLDDVPEGQLKDALNHALDIAEPGNKATKEVLAAIDTLTSDPKVMEQAVELAENQSALDVSRAMESAGASAKGGSFLKRLLGKGANKLLATVDRIPRGEFRFNTADPAFNMEEADRTLRSLRYMGFDQADRDLLVRAMGETNNNPAAVEDWFKNVFAEAAHRDGVTGDINEALDEILKTRGAGMAHPTAFSLTDEGELVTRPQTLSQEVARLRHASVNDLERAITRELARGGDTWAQVKFAVSKVYHGVDFTINGKTFNLVGSPLKILNHIWRVLVVSNGYAPLIYGGAALALGEGSLSHRLQEAALFGGLGTLGSLRLGQRLGIQDRVTSILQKGFVPEEWIPGLSSFLAKRVAADAPFTGMNEISPLRNLSETLDNRSLITADADWAAIGKGDKHFLDAWNRIVNYQINPAEDAVMEFTLAEKAGEMTKDGLKERLKEYFRTPEGAEWQARAKRAGVTPQTEQDFVNRYITTPELARARLEGKLSPDQMSGFLKDAPNVVHGQLPKMPSKFSELLPSFANLQRHITEKVQNAVGGKKAAALWEYAKRYSDLKANGFSTEMAQKYATELTVRDINERYFRIDNASRFAQKTDYAMPFQAHRELNFKLWTKAIIAHPFRNAYFGNQAAIAFNFGKDNGVFKKDSYGRWTMSIPGSAWAAEHIFGVGPHLKDFEVPLANFMIATEGAFGSGTFGTGFVPTIGGPFGILATQAFKEVLPQVWASIPTNVKNILMPFGGGEYASTLSPLTNRLWMSMTGDTPPWEIFDKQQQQSTINRYEQEMRFQLMVEHFKRTKDPNWTPSHEEVQQAMQHLMGFWGFLTSVFPASPTPITPGREQYETAVEVYKATHGGKFDYNGFLAAFPALEPYTLPQTGYIHPDDTKKGFETFWQRAQRQAPSTERGYLSDRAWVKQFEHNRYLSKAYAAKNIAEHTKGPVWKRELAMEQWEAQYPDVADLGRHNYAATKELAYIITHYPKREQAAAIDRWRKQYAIQGKDYKSLLKKAKAFQESPFNDARPPQEIHDTLKDTYPTIDSDPTAEADAVASLPPAEQYRYWQWKQAQLSKVTLNIGTADAAKALKAFKATKSALFTVGQNYGNILFTPKPPNPWDEWVNKFRGDTEKVIGGAYNEINRVRDAMAVAKAKKDWGTYDSLYKKEQSLYQLVQAANNKQYEAYPDMGQVMDDLKAVQFYTDIKDTNRVNQLNQKVRQDLTNAPWLFSNEENSYMNLPDNMKNEYIQELVDSMSITPDQYHAKYKTPAGSGKKFWSELTTFQQNLLQQAMPQDAIQSWMAQSPKDSVWKSSGSGKGGTSYKHFRSTKFSTRSDSLGFAFSLMDEYTKRPKGAKPPPAYAEYLKLPSNPAIRNDFLGKHPEVAKWIADGPFANMPPVYRYMVQNIMVKYGKWQGEMKSIPEIEDLSFAQQQLETWNKRTGPAPGTYDIWVNMPSGPEKAAYLDAHPEVQKWLQLGPMSNMPDAYKEVVRDIMQRYGLWTARQDPLGETISQYYQTPSEFREQFLANHPELTAYWSALRSPEENAMADLANTYFAIPDADARRAFMVAHPELGSYFLKQREDRYSRFLNQVAVYMGSNPELFQGYLQKQTDLLAELVRRFGEPVLVREVPRLSDTKASVGNKADTGRQRQARR